MAFELAILFHDEKEFDQANPSLQGVGVDSEMVGYGSCCSLFPVEVEIGVAMFEVVPRVRKLLSQNEKECDICSSRPPLSDSSCVDVNIARGQIFSFQSSSPPHPLDVNTARGQIFSFQSSSPPHPLHLSLPR